MAAQRITTGINWEGYVELLNGTKLYTGTGVFTTTGTTVTIYHPLTTILGFSLTRLAAAYDADDALSLTLGTAANTVTHATDGSIACVTAGTAQVLRNSSGTSGLAFSVVMIGR